MEHPTGSRKSSHDVLEAGGRPRTAALTTTEFVERAKAHPKHQLIDYSKVVYKNGSTKVTLVCTLHGEFEQLPRNHLKGFGCKICSGLAPLTTEAFVLRAKEMPEHCLLDYSKVRYHNSRSKITIVCQIHGDFHQSPHSHLKGESCPKCALTRLTTEEFIRQARAMPKHHLISYSKVAYVNAHTKVTLTCGLHGDFEQAPGHHLRGLGCPVCNKPAPVTTESFILRASAMAEHQTVDYSKVCYVAYQSHVTLICKLHGEFQQTPNNHLNGNSCPACAKEARLMGYSPMAIRWLNLVARVNGIDIIHAENNGGKEHVIRVGSGVRCVDGYCRETNTVYEFHGGFWHGDERVYDHADTNAVNGKTFGQLFKETCARDQAIIDSGYNLVTMWEYDFKDLEKLHAQKKIVAQQERFRAYFGGPEETVID